MKEKNLEGNLALASLAGQVAWRLFIREAKDCIAAQAVNQYGEFLVKNDVLSKAQLAELWRADGDAMLLLRGEREVRIGRTAELFANLIRLTLFDVLSHTEGLPLPPRAAARSLQIMDRLACTQPLITEEEHSANYAPLREGEILNSLSKLKAALGKVAEDGPEAGDDDAKKEGLLILSSLTNFMTAGLGNALGQQNICGPIMHRYSNAVSKGGFCETGATARLWNEGGEKVQPMQEACERTIYEAASRMANMLGNIIVDLLSRTGGVTFTAAGANRSLELLERLLTHRALVTAEEYRRLDEEWARRVPGGSQGLADMLRQAAKAEEAAES